MPTVPEKISLGNLILGAEIGRGGYGTVFKARLDPLRLGFAVKLLDPSPFHSDPERLFERFVREAEILMTLRHQFITPVFGVGECFPTFKMNHRRRKEE